MSTSQLTVKNVFKLFTIIYERLAQTPLGRFVLNRKTKASRSGLSNANRSISVFATNQYFRIVLRRIAGVHPRLFRPRPFVVPRFFHPQTFAYRPGTQLLASPGRRQVLAFSTVLFHPRDRSPSRRRRRRRLVNNNIFVFHRPSRTHPCTDIAYTERRLIDQTMVARLLGISSKLTFYDTVFVIYNFRYRNHTTF